MKRRSILAVAGVGLLSGLGGCLDFVLGNEPLEVGAGEVHPSDEAVTETDYEFVEADEFVVEETVEAAGQSREVVATNVHVQYDRSIETGLIGSVQGAIFSVVSTPSVEVLGREFNPLGGMDTDRLVTLVQNRYESVENVSHDEDRQLTINDQDVTVGIYSAQATISGQQIDVYLHVTEAVDFGEDLAVAVGAFPQSLPEEADNVDRLMESLTASE